MPLEIVRNDITTMQVDVIVNAANRTLQMGGGVCGAIFNAAGATALQAACDEIGECPVGEAVLTDGFELKAKKIIHTVGPIWQGGDAHEAQLLTNCYQNALALAVRHGYASIAFPLISSGIYGYPKAEALQIAIATIGEFLLEHDLQVYLVVYDQQAFGVSKKLFTSITAYIDEHYIEERETTYDLNRRILVEEMVQESQVAPSEIPSRKRSLADVLAQLDESFSQGLLRLIDEKGLTDAETYRKANIDRRLFSKIRNTVDYPPPQENGDCFRDCARIKSG